MSKNDNTSSSSAPRFSAALHPRYDVFISYRVPDAQREAMLVYGLLTTLGFNTFLDGPEIGLAEQWSDVIISSLDNSRSAVVLLSRTFYDSDFCNREVQRASEKKILTTFIALDAVEIREPLRSCQGITNQQYMTQGFAKSIQRLITDLQGSMHVSGSLNKELAQQARNDKLSSTVSAVYHEVSALLNQCTSADSSSTHQRSTCEFQRYREGISRLAHAWSEKLTEQKSSPKIRIRTRDEATVDHTVARLPQENALAGLQMLLSGGMGIESSGNSRVKAIGIDTIRSPSASPPEDKAKEERKAGPGEEQAAKKEGSK